MKAVAVFPGDKQIRVIDRPAPALERDGDVRLRMLEIGVCGTDREIARFQYGTPPQGDPYLVIGHESLGEVVEVGKAVTRVKPGDLVVTTVRRPCGRPECMPCKMNRPDFCRTAQYTERGIKGRHGFMTEEVVDDAHNMHLVPRGLRDIAVLTEPLTIAEKGLIELFDIETRFPWVAPRSRDSTEDLGLDAVVLGAGPVGLLGALALLVRGFRTWVYSRESATSDRAAWIKRVGGRYICSGDVPVAKLPEVVGDISLIYEATGAAGLAFDAMAAIGTNGMFIFTGVPGRKAPITLDAQLIMRNLVLKNQLLYGTVNAGPPAFEASIADLARIKARWPDEVRALITGRHAPEAAPGVLAGDRAGIKEVISFGKTGG